jgi:hypothetical protein
MSVFVMIVLRDNCVEKCRVFDDYDSAGYAAGSLLRQMMTEQQWFEFVQSDSMPNFAAGEWYSRDGLRIGIEGPITSEVFI